MKVLVIDNIDSFVYNLAQYLGELGAEVVVRRNDLGEKEMLSINPDKVLISPGPGHPRDSKATLTALRVFEKNKPILGVCLGHQAIGMVYGAKIGHAKNLLHGKTSKISHDGKTIYQGLKNPFEATRYHSLVVEKQGLPDCLEVSSTDQYGEIMGIRHREHQIEGVQYHPESILTGEGKKLLKNWLEQ